MFVRQLVQNEESSVFIYISVKLKHAIKAPDTQSWLVNTS